MTKPQRKQKLKNCGLKEGDTFLFVNNVLLHGASLDTVVKKQNAHRETHKNSDLTPERAILLILEGK